MISISSILDEFSIFGIFITKNQLIFNLFELKFCRFDICRNNLGVHRVINFCVKIN